METPLTGYWLAPQQRRLWELQQQDRGLPARTAGAFRIEGELDPGRLRAAVETVAARHEILCTAFRRLPGMGLPLQTVLELSPSWSPGLELTDELARRPVDLENGPLLECSLTTLSPASHRLVVALPALCSDVAGLELLAREIGRAYAGNAGEEPVQYIDLAEWQNDLLTSEETAEARDYWRRQDLSALGQARLASGGTGSAGPFAPRRVSERVPPALAGGLRRLAAELGVPLAAVLLAACRVLVHRLTGAGEVVFGVAHDGRRFAELEGALGRFARYLPLPGSIDPGVPFRELVGRDAASMERSRAWQESFAWPEDGGGPVTFPLLFDLVEMAEPWPEGGLSWSQEDYRDCPERFEVRLSFVRRGEELRLDLGFDPGLLPAREARSLAERLLVLLAGAVADPSVPAGALGLLGEAERHALLREVNDTAADLGGGRTLHGLFREQAARTPDRIAAEQEDLRLTYAGLKERVLRLAGRLRRLGVGPEVRVGVLMDRSLDMLVSLLAVLEAGGAYVPLDPGYPEERLALMLEDSRPRVVLAPGQAAESLPLGGALWIDPMDAEDADPADGPAAGPDHLAYVIYTSGSTGRPKGVMIPHRGIVNRLLWMQRRFPLAADDAVLQKTPISFDASVWEIFLPLLAGARVILARPGAQRDPAEMASAVQEHGVTVLQLVPSQLAVFLSESKAADCSSLRRLFCGGEALPRRLGIRLREVLDVELVNLYGPTESSIDASSRPCGRGGVDGDGPAVPIGRPLDNVSLYLADAGLRPVPPGRPGEILIGGAGLARGYLGRPELTAERFVPSPFGEEPGARLYRTGDLGRFLPDLEIEFLGRLDGQVKLRGFRIELGEVEAALAAHPEVADAVVAIREDETGGGRLVAYVVPRGDGALPTWTEGLRGFLQRKLPQHMVPAAFVPLESLPLAPNGKVDRRALPAPEEAAARGRDLSVAPRTAVEEVIAGIWSDLLSIPQPGIDEDFFDLGGHSLVATQVVSRVRQAFLIELPLHVLFAAPTVAGLAAAVEMARGAGEAPPIQPIPRDGELPLSFAQQRLWFLEHFQPGEATYNIPTSARLTGPLDVGAFGRALCEIVRRHEILRTIYPGEDGRPRQVILPELDLPLPLIDLGALPEPLREAEARRLATGQARRPLPLASGPLLRTFLFRLGPGEHVVACILHHIVSDAWSGGVLMRELAALYAAFRAGEPSPLPPLPIQYVDFAAWQRKRLSGEELARQIAYWRRLEGAPPLLELPADHSRPQVLSTRGATRPFALPEDLAGSLRALGRREGTTLFMTLLAAFQVLLHAETGQVDLVVGTDVANRNRVETEGLIGFFINQLVLRTDLGGNPTFRELLARVREVTLGAYEHQDLPFEQVLEILKPQRTLRHAPVFQVKLFLVNTPPVRSNLPGLAISPFGIDAGTSRLDLVLALSETPEGLNGWINYSTDLFEPETVGRLLDRFAGLLRHVAERPDDPLDHLAGRLAEMAREQESTALRSREKAKLQKFRRDRRPEQDLVTAGLAGQES
jgi:amino acid adenylation domain-containing protein